MNENNVVAIDFGTSRTKLAYFNPKTEKVELMRHRVENYLPSYFAVDEKGKILLGYEAQKRLESGYRQAVSNLKGQISELSIKSPFFQQTGKTPQELLIALFTHLREETGKLSAFETTPQRAFLTHPTTFSETDKEILKNAAQDAGFSVELIEEPVAAAEFVRRSRRDLPTDLIILDCGAGTLHWTYMVRYNIIYGDEPKHMIERDIKPDGTPTGIPDGEDEIKVGGSFIEWSLANTLQKRIGSITADDSELLLHELKVRKELFCRNPNPDDEIPPIKIRDFSVPVNGREMKAAIENSYIRPACNVVAPYIKRVIDVTEAGGRKPALLLTGGCAHIKDFKIALEEKFELDCIVIPEYEYATVRGAVPLPEGIRSELPEQSEGTETAESEETEILNGSMKTEMLNKSIKEKFHEFGSEFGEILADKAMSRLINRVGFESSNRGYLDIGGDDEIYLYQLSDLIDFGDGNSFVGYQSETRPIIKQNIIRHFVDDKSIPLLPDTITDLFRDDNDFPNRLYEEELLEAIPSRIRKPVLPICEDCVSEVRKVVENILDKILTEIDIPKIIKAVVVSRQQLRRSLAIFFPWETIIIRQPRRAKSRRIVARASICSKLKEQLEKSRNTHEAQIRDAVVEVLKSTAEELCQQLIDAPDHVKNSRTS